jgi:hypothetical protein
MQGISQLYKGPLAAERELYRKILVHKTNIMFKYKRVQSDVHSSNIEY